MFHFSDPTHDVGTGQSCVNVMASGTGARQKTSSKHTPAHVNGQRDTPGAKPVLTTSKSEQELEASML